MGPPGHVTDVGDGPSGACFWFWDLWTGGQFLVLGTYGGWVATLENPFGTLEALETLGTQCVALCGDKVRTNFLLGHLQAYASSTCRIPLRSLLLLVPHMCSAVPLLP